MRLVVVVLFWGFAAEASAQICSGEGDYEIVSERDGVLDRLATLTGTIVGLDEGERTGVFSVDDTPPCGPCMEDASAGAFSGTYHSYLFQYYAALDAPADASFVVANDAQAVILQFGRLSATDDPGLIPALLRMAGDRSIEGDDVVTVNGRTITLHFEASLLRGLDHVRVLTLTGGDCTPMIPDAGGHDGGVLPGLDGGSSVSDGSAGRDASGGGEVDGAGAADGSNVARRDSGSSPRASGYQFEGGGGCACRASGDAGFAPMLLLLLLYARARRRDSR